MSGEKRDERNGAHPPQPAATDAAPSYPHNQERDEEEKTAISHTTAGQQHHTTTADHSTQTGAGQPPFTHSSHHATAARPSFTPSTPVRPIHAAYPASSTSYITPASSTASHLLPPYSTSSLPTLSTLSLPPPPHSHLTTSHFPTPAKAKLNSYLVELVKNSIRITDEFSAMCRAKVAEKEAIIAQLREEIDSLRVRAAGTQTSDVDGREQEQTEEERTARQGVDGSFNRKPGIGRDETAESEEKTSKAPQQRPPFDSADAALQYVLAAKDDRIRVLQAQLTALRASVQQQQAGADANARRLVVQRDRAENAAQMAHGCHAIIWLLLAIVALLSFAAALHFRDAVVPAVCDHVFPIISQPAQEGMLCSVAMREQCELEKDKLLLTWEQTHAHDQHHHHHAHGHDHSHPHIEEVTYQVQDCPPPVVCPACPKVTCPPPLPVKEYETGQSACLNPLDADASFLLSLSKGELIMQLLQAREVAESGRQWEVTHRISKERWEREKQQHAAEAHALKAALDAAPQQTVNDEEANKLKESVSECERQRDEEKAGNDEMRTKLTLLQAEHEKAKELLDKQDHEKVRAEAQAQCEKQILAAVAAEHARLTDAHANAADAAKARVAELKADNDKLRADSDALKEQLDAAEHRTCVVAVSEEAEMSSGNATATVLVDPPVHDVAVTFDSMAWQQEKSDLVAANTALQARLDDQLAACEAHKQAADTLVTVQELLSELYTNYTELQQALEEQRNQSTAALSDSDLQGRLEDKAVADAATISELTADLTQRTTELQQLDAALTSTQTKLEQALQQLQEALAKERELRASLSGLEDENTLNGLLVEELKVELDDMQRWYEQRLTSMREQLTDEEQWQHEMEQTRAMIDGLREHVLEAERMGDEVRILLTSLNSTADISAAGQLANGLHDLDEAQGVDHYATAQLELIEARINMSRLADEKRELVREMDSLQQQLHTLSLTQPLDALATSSTPSPHSSLEWEQARLSHQQQVSRLQEELDVTKLNLRECVTKSAQLQSDLERAHASLLSGASASGGADGAVAPSFRSLFASPAYLPFLPGVPLPPFFSSFSHWSPVYKLLFLFSLISVDLLLFQLLLLPSRHRVYTSVMTGVWVASSAVCVHYHQFFLALFAAANALMCVWVVVQPSAALFACQWTCCGRGGSGKKQSTAVVLSNGKQQPAAPALLSSPPPPQLMPANLAPSLPLPSTNTGVGLPANPGAPLLPSRSGMMPPPPARGPTQTYSPVDSSRPLPASSAHSPFPPSPSSRMPAPQSRRPSLLSDDSMVLPSPTAQAAGSSLPPPPAAGVVPHFHRQPTSTRMDVMEERQLPQSSMARSTTFSSRVDIASSPAGTHLVPDADTETKDVEGGARLSPMADATPTSRSRVTFSDSVAPAAAPILEGDGEESLSRTSSVSSDRSFISTSPLSTVYASFNNALTHSPLSLQASSQPFSASQTMTAPAPAPHFPASTAETDSAYPSELAPSSYPSSAASSRRSSLSGPAMPPMPSAAGLPPMPTPGMPMPPPRSAAGGGGANAGGYGRRPALMDDDFA